MRKLSCIGFVMVLAACVPVQREVPAPRTGTTPSSGWEGDAPAEPVALSGSRIPERVLKTGILETGSSGALVTMLVITHPSCGYCRALHQQVLPEAAMDAVRAGTVRIHTMLLPLKKYPESAQQAGLLLCAALQKNGAAMLDTLMRGGIKTSDLTASAPCLSDPKNAEKLAIQASLAETLGVRLVPTIVLNGNVHVGLPEASDLRGMIEAALAKAAQMQ